MPDRTSRTAQNLKSAETINFLSLSEDLGLGSVEDRLPSSERGEGNRQYTLIGDPEPIGTGEFEQQCDPGGFQGDKS